MNKPTVASAALLRMAERTESYANDSQHAWILVGDYESYSRKMSEAAALRRAAAEKSMYTRREILRNNGIEA